MKIETFTCARCGAIHPLSECEHVDEHALCPACVLNKTVVCERCGTRVLTENSHYAHGETLCEDCFDECFARCEGCGEVLPRDAAYYLPGDDNPYCEDCYNDRAAHCAVHEYSYRPELEFFGDGNRYFGVELEIDGAGESECHAERILRVANEHDDHLYIKTDGSLDEGLELVTHPMTLDYHMNSMPWEAVLEKALSLGYLSHRAGTCGLHVHISRRAFGKTHLEQECSIARLLYFFERFWPELLRFSRRTERQVNRWAARYGMKLSPQEVLDSAKDSCIGRYAAVNLTNDETVEIRLFRGTLKLNTLFATLQLVDAICDVAVFMSDEDLQALSWHSFLDRLSQPQLIQYLKERGLYRNDPVLSEEEA